MVDRCVISFVARVSPCVSTQQRDFLEIGGDTPGSLNQLGIMHARKELWRDSTNYFNMALRTNVPRPVILNNLAICLEYLGSMDEATQNYQEAYDLSTNNVILRNLLDHKRLKQVFCAPVKGQGSIRDQK
jgi:Flp pilus assembly protein TadD